MRVARNAAWRPLLQGDQAARAIRIAQEIAGDVRAHHPPESLDASLACGAAGIALLFDALHRSLAVSAYAGVARRYWEASVTAMSRRYVSAGLGSGFSGVGWVTAFLEGRGTLEPGSGDRHASIERALEDHIATSPYAAHGLVDFGIYALERWPQPGARRLLRAISAQLARQAQRTSAGVTWLTRPEQLSDRGRAAYPKGYYSLEFLHGVPGRVVLASQCLAIEPAAIAPLLEGSVRWLLAQANEAQDLYAFPDRVTPDGRHLGGSLTWFSGDLGVATAVAMAADCARRQDWWRAALDVALRAATHDPQRDAETSTGLGFGAAGVGHMFGRLHRALDDDRLAHAGRGWLQRTMEIYKPFHVVADRAAPGGAPDRATDPGFLAGAAGVALALLAGATSVPPDWDRCLLLSRRGLGNGETPGAPASGGARIGVASDG